MLNNEPEPLSGTVLPDIIAFREAARALSIRAMQQMGEDRLDKSWQDLLAIHRLAHLTEQGPTMVAELVAITISGIACDATLTLLRQGNLTVDQAKQIQSDLSALPHFSMARALEGERLWAIGGILQCSKEGSVQLFSGLSEDPDTAIYQMIEVLSIDWNVALQNMNRIYDRLAASAACATRQQRIAGLSQVDFELKQATRSFSNPSKLIGGALTRQARANCFPHLSPAL